MKSLPQVAIVGFPNVGKSTLFNGCWAKEIPGHSLAGMTRDRRLRAGGDPGKKADPDGYGGLGDPSRPRWPRRSWRRPGRPCGNRMSFLLVLDGKRDLAARRGGAFLFR